METDNGAEPKHNENEEVLAAEESLIVQICNLEQQIKSPSINNIFSG